MALVVEDGTGKPNAESYASVAEGTAYVTGFYLTGSAQLIAWTAAAASPGTQAEVALRKATRDLDATYGSSFVSERLTDTQALEFPRADPTGVPTVLKNATIELALLVLAGVDIIGPDSNASSIKSVSQKLGSLEKSVEYFASEDYNSDAATKVETILLPLLDDTTDSSISVELVRG